MTSVGNRLRGLRCNKDWTQTSLGQHMAAAGHPTWFHGVVYRIEVGVRHLYFTEAIDLSRILGVSLDDLAYGEAEPEQMVATHVARLLQERHDLCVRLAELDRLLATHAPPVLPQRSHAMPERIHLGEAEEPVATEAELTDDGAAPPPEVTQQDDGADLEPDTPPGEDEEDTR